MRCRAKVGFDACDVNDNFATVGQKQLHIVWALNLQNFERAGEFGGQFAIFIEEIKIVK